MDSITQVADAIREVTAKMQQAIDAGKRSQHIDAHDLVEVLLAIADGIDPPLADLVPIADACPNCGEREPDKLVWQNDETLLCDRCGTNYRPGA